MITAVSGTRATFLSAIEGDIKDPASITASLDAADAAATHFDGIIDQYVHGYKSRSIPEPVIALYRSASKPLLLSGLYTHYICYGSHTRHRFAEVPVEVVATEWARMAAGALGTLESYSKANMGFPENVFQRLYANPWEAGVREAGVGFFKRSSVAAAFKDRYATGITLGMTLSIATARLQPA